MLFSEKQSEFGFAEVPSTAFWDFVCGFCVLLFF